MTHHCLQLSPQTVSEPGQCVGTSLVPFIAWRWGREVIIPAKMPDLSDSLWQPVIDYRRFVGVLLQNEMNQKMPVWMFNP
jgi:hypothetical protein